MALVLDGNNLLTTGVLNSMTTQSASGTYIDFIGIPVGVKRVTAVYNVLSTSGSYNHLLQIGSGSIKTSGYASAATYVSGSVGYQQNTTGFVFYNGASSYAFSGAVTLYTLGSNIWVASGVVADYASQLTDQLAGSVTLSGALDRVRFTTVNGTDTFDAGSVTVFYE